MDADLESMVMEPRPDEALEPRVGFILLLARALHRYGTPAHRLEEMLVGVAERLGVEARFFSTPTSLVASFGPPQALRSCLIRMEPGDIDLERLSQVDAAALGVLHGGLSATEGARRVEAVLTRPGRYPLWLQLVCWGLAGGAAGRLFGGGHREMAVAALASLLIGAMDASKGRFPSMGRVLDPVAAVLASALAVVAAHLAGPLSVKVATLAGLIVLLPGITLTTAVTELATRNLISGTSRLMGAVVVLLQLGFGVALGSRLAGVLPAIPLPPSPVPPPAWTELPALAAITLALGVLFKVRPWDAGWIALANALAYNGARVGATFFGAELGAFFGAMVLAMYSNALARARNKPSLITILPGLVLLVPGSVGFRSLESLMERNVVAGVDTAFSMALISVALCAGLLVGAALVPSRRAL